jgi:hypothetical protein
MSDTLSDPERDAAPAGEEDDDPLAFDPVALRRRTDGWTPDKQTDFIAALAETGCVEEACRRDRCLHRRAQALVHGAAVRARPDCGP